MNGTLPAMDNQQPITATSLSIVPANQVPWDDLHAVFGDRDSDDSVWAVTCLVVRKGYRRRGVTYALAAAAVGYAKANGARALEAYAMLTQPGREITWGELHVGARQVFAEAGLAEVSRPSVRRAVMRIDFDAADGAAAADDSAAAGRAADGRADNV
jgi:GNAT superfamily N-acetyltransferase